MAKQRLFFGLAVLLLGVSSTVSAEEYLRGIDVSNWQGSVDWATVRNSGVAFAFVKTTEGCDYTDPGYASRIQGAHDAGIMVGAYHFARPDTHTTKGNNATITTDATNEASDFVSYSRSSMQTGYLRPVLDMEAGATALTGTELSLWTNTFVNRVKTLTGLDTIIYCNTDWARHHLDSSVTGSNLWIANYNGGPSSGNEPGVGVWWTAGKNWDFWQWTSSGSVPGVPSSNVDHDVCRMNLADYAIHGSLYWNGGSGDWDATAMRWSTANGGSADTPWSNYNGADAVFQSATGTTTVAMASGGVVANSLTFNTPGSVYALVGGPLTLTASGGLITVNSGVSASIASGICGDVGLTKNGGGLLTLGGVNAYSGNTAIVAGTLQLNSGSSITGGSLIVGNASGSQGRLNVSPGALVHVASAAGPGGSPLAVGACAGSAGLLVQTGGRLWIEGGNESRIGGATSDAGSARGDYRLSAGTLDNPGNFQVGAFGSGVMTQTGGNADIGGWFSVGRFAGGVGMLDMSSGNGVLTATGTPNIIVGEEGKGTFLLGGNSNVSVNGIRLCQASGSTGNLTMTGGNLSIGSSGIYATYANAATVNLGGGTIRSMADWTSDLGMNLTGTNGNITFNTNGHSTTLNGVLASSGGLTKAGAGSLILGGANRYTGATTVKAGLLSVTGSLANNGSDKVFVQADNGSVIVRRVANGGSYAGLGATALGGDFGSAASIVAGQAGSQTDVSMSWRTRDAAEKTKLGGGLISDVVNVSFNSAAGGKTDCYLLQVSYSTDALQSIWGVTEQQAIDQRRLYLAYRSSSGEWVKAVNGNVGGVSTWKGNLAAPLGNMDAELGWYGVDAATDTVWAVLDHNSEFAAVPEPGTVVLLGTGLGCLALGVWRKRPKASR
jgi:autotransporter-associated beta strand protein